MPTEVDTNTLIKGGGAQFYCLLAQPASLPSIISSFLTQNKTRAPRTPLLDPPLNIWPIIILFDILAHAHLILCE